MKQKTVVLGMSGGVDSSVAALLLKKQGYKVIGIFLRNYPDNTPYLNQKCPFRKDKQIAQKIAEKLKIHFKVLDYRKQYLKEVIEPMFRQYKKNLTPNPDTDCNKIIKFPALWKEAKKLKADFIATGHYARIKKTEDGFKLMQGKDKKKDQSYFLYQLTQKDLSHTLFPVGDLTKMQVRNIAKKNKFPNYDKKGSRGICFIGKLNFKDFLKKKIKEKPGKIFSTEGEVIGAHPGAVFFTIGERIGPRHKIRIKNNYKPQEKLYIAEKKGNDIIVAIKNHPILKKKKIKIKNLHIINPKNKIPKTNLKARIRHLDQLNKGKLSKDIFTLEKPIESVAEGQAIVIYRGQELIGGGEIRLN